MASPKEWDIKDGDKVEVDTPFTNRARELVELYSGLCEYQTSQCCLLCCSVNEC